MNKSTIGKFSIVISLLLFLLILVLVLTKIVTDNSNDTTTADSKEQQAPDTKVVQADNNETDPQKIEATDRNPKEEAAEGWRHIQIQCKAIDHGQIRGDLFIRVRLQIKQQGITFVESRYKETDNVVKHQLIDGYCYPTYVYINNDGVAENQFWYKSAIGSEDTLILEVADQPTLYDRDSNWALKLNPSFCFAEPKSFIINKQVVLIEHTFTCQDRAMLTVELFNQKGNHIKRISQLLFPWPTNGQNTLMGDSTHKIPVPAGQEFELKITADGLLNKTVKVEPLYPGEQRSIKVTMEWPVKLFQGIVTDEIGQTIQGALVSIYQKDLTYTYARTTKSGEFKLAIADQPLDIRVQKNRYVGFPDDEFNDFYQKSIDPDSQPSIKLTKLAVVVSGKVVYEDGVPAANIPIYYQQNALEPQSINQPSEENYSLANTDENGNFAIKGLPNQSLKKVCFGSGPMEGVGLYMEDIRPGAVLTVTVKR